MIQCFNTQLVATALTRVPTPERRPVITAAPSVVREQHSSHGICFSVMNSLSLLNACSAVLFTSKSRQHKYSSTILYESISGILMYTSSCALLPISVDSSSYSPQHGAFPILYKSCSNKSSAISNPRLLTVVSDRGMFCNLRSVSLSRSCSVTICNAGLITSSAKVNGFFVLRIWCDSRCEVNNKSWSVFTAPKKESFCCFSYF